MAFLLLGMYKCILIGKYICVIKNIRIRKFSKPFKLENKLLPFVTKK